MLFRPWRGRCDTRPSGQVTGSVGQPPDTLALAAVLRLPATPPHSPQPEYALASLCTKCGRPCRSPCSGPVAVDLFLSFLTKLSLLCCICSYSCYSTRNPSGPPSRNRPCCASCFCSVLGTGRPQPCRQIAQDSFTPPGPPGGVVAWGLSPRRHDPDGSASALRPIVGCHV